MFTTARHKLVNYTKLLTTNCKNNQNINLYVKSVLFGSFIFVVCNSNNTNNANNINNTNNTNNANNTNLNNTLNNDDEFISDFINEFIRSISK